MLKRTTPVNRPTARRAEESAPDLSHLPEWAQMAYADLASSARMVGALESLDELTEDYLSVSGREESCWPARAYWREMAAYMGEARRQRLAVARLWPEYLRFRQGRRSPGCTEVRRLVLAGGRPRGMDCLHAARCDHCRMFCVFYSA